MKKIVFITLIMIGIFLRVFLLGSVPAGLFSDEISIAVNSKTIAENGTDEYGSPYPFAFESVSDFKMPGYIYLTSIVYHLFGNTTLTVRLVSVTASIISVLAIGFLAKFLFPHKKDIQWYAMIILSLCLFHIHLSRIAYETMLATSMIILFLIGFWKSLTEKKKGWWIVLASISLLMSTWSYYAPRFIIPLIIFSYIFYHFFFITKRKKLKFHLTLISIYALVIAIAFLPGLLGSKVDNRPLSYLLSDTEGGFFSAVLFKIRTILGSFIWNFNLEFLFDKGDVFAFRHGTKDFGIFLSIFVIPYLYGMYLFLKEFSVKNKELVFILLFTVIAGLPSALTSGVPYAPRLLPFIIPLTLVISLGSVGFFDALRKYNQRVNLIAVLGILGIIFFQILQYTHGYFVHYKKNSLPEFPSASVEIGKYVAQILNENPKQKLYFLNGRSCRNWGHDDLFLWYFGNISNDKMIKWNNIFRDIRYTRSSPFDAYDEDIQPRVELGNIIMNPTYKEGDEAPVGSIHIRCGIHEETFNKKKETKLKTIYMYPYESREAYYVITQTSATINE